MNCAECREILVGYIEGLLQDAQQEAVVGHLKDCSVCRAELAELAGLRDRLVANGKVLAESSVEDKVLDRIIREQSVKLKKANKLEIQFLLWRNIMKSRITKLSAAAVIVAAVVLSVTFLNTSVTPAYALEQTIQANHSVRFLHIKDFKADQNEPKEFWVECDESGQIKNMRLYFPDWASCGDGPKVVVWSNNKATAWFKKKNSMFTVSEKKITEEFLKVIEECDPRLGVERLHEQEGRGKVKMDVNEPSDKSNAIVVTTTYLPESQTPGKQVVLFVDQATKLVTSMEFYQLKDGKYQYTGVMEFYDYNQPIEVKMFDLDSEVPSDIMRVDQTTQEVGLVQGQLSNEQIAVEVARQFFQALIDKDYDKASKLYEGVPASTMQKGFGRINFIRIVSIGKPTPHPIPATHFLCVPCKIEIEANGVKTTKEFVPNIREVYNKPGRWTVGGGI